MARKFLLIGFLCSLLLITSCSLSATKQITGTSTTSNSIIIKDFAFIPATLEIKPNTTITWLNNDSVPHKIVLTNLFESPILKNESQFQYTFTTAGTFDYNCQIHPTMKGQIIVK